jgi:hypothetical protein
MVEPMIYEGRPVLGPRDLPSLDPTAWYWLVENRPDLVYSSAAAAYVATDDATYTDWVAAGNVASPILADGELADVLAKRGLNGPTVLNTEPTEWGGCTAADITGAMQAAGVEITSNATPALNGHYQLAGPFDAMSRTAIYVASYDKLPNDQPIVWPCYDGPVTLASPADFNAVYQGLQDYYNAWQVYALNGGTMPTWGSKTIA